MFTYFPYVQNKKIYGDHSLSKESYNLFGTITPYISGESDGYSITSSLSRRSSSGLSRSKSARQTTIRSISSTSGDEVAIRPVSTTRPQTAVTKTVIKPPLTKSLFPNVPPTINFVVEGEKGNFSLATPVFNFTKIHNCKGDGKRMF